MRVNLEKAVEKARKERAKENVQQIRPDFEPPISPSNKPDHQEIRRVQLDKKILSQNHCVCALLDMPESNFYRALRVRIQQRLDENDWRTVMITSTTPNEGKTLTSINLSFSFAKAYDQTVFLIDADLRKQQVHKTLGIESQYGFVDYMVKKRPMQDCMIHLESEKMVILSGGQTVEDSSELLSSHMMKDFVLEVRDRYTDRLVLFDVPPVTVSPDALAFAPIVDGIIVVVKAGQTSLKQLRRAVDMLPREKMVGLVVNGQTENSVTSYYYEK